jgi:uncharacterized integral membrane protein
MAWTPLITVIVLLVAVLVFIVQNLKTVRVSFFTVDWKLPLALDLLLAAVLGGLLVLTASWLRALQRRRAARRDGRRNSSREGSTP